MQRLPNGSVQNDTVPNEAVPNETVPKKTVTNKRDVPNGTVCYSIGEEVVKVFIINSRDDEEAVLKS